jgi:hypothetical protein
MYIKKLIIIIILLIIIIILTTNRDTFQSNNENINLLVDTSDYNTIQVQDAKLKLDTNYNSDFNIDIGNSIIAEDSIIINGKVIDIEKIRYIKKLPIHYQDEICLSDKDGVECIKKEHIDVLKGQLPMNIVTYPDNRRKCIKAVEKSIIPEWTHGPWNYQIYTADDCKNGETSQEFFIKRTSQDTHDSEAHYHIHGVDSNSEDYKVEPLISLLPSTDNPNAHLIN